MKQHARVIACLMFALCVGSSMGATIASIWQQCGGTSCPSGVCQDAEWKDTKCAAGLKCFRQSEYYYQCRATAQLYEQCGGTSCQFKGVCADSNWAACTNDHKCVRKSEFYWQCLPANLAQVQSTTTKASVQSAAAAPSSAKNMRLSQAQLAHVPIPRHSVVHVSSKKPAAEDAVASIASVAAPTRIRPVEEAQPEQIRPAAAAAVSTAAIKPAAASAATAAKPATIGMPYSSEPTKPSATVASKATPVSIASTSSSSSSSASTAAAAKPSRESKPAAVGMPYSAEPTKPAQDASVSVASAAATAAKPSGESKPAGMPYSAEPTRPGSSSSSNPAASISTAALSSRAARAEPSSSAAARGAREQRDAAELQWERPALSTASVRSEEPRPAGRRPPQMRPQT